MVNGESHCRYFLWRFGETANAGIQEIAETGAGEQFFAEVEACGAACSEGVSMPCDPFSGVCKSEATITVTPDRPYLSLASMVAPSPDWCVRLLPPPTPLPAPRALPCHHRHMFLSPGTNNAPLNHSA